MKRIQKKKGLSPVVATVLLIAIVIAIALIIFLWFRSTLGETITKFNGKNIELVCQEDVDFDASFSSSTNTLEIVNKGTSPIFSFEIRVINGGSYETFEIDGLTSLWPGDGLKQSGTFSGTISGGAIESADELLLIPILLGNSEDGQVTYTCDERYGVSVEV